MMDFDKIRNHFLFCLHCAENSDITRRCDWRYTLWYTLWLTLHIAVTVYVALKLWHIKKSQSQSVNQSIKFLGWPK